MLSREKKVSVACEAIFISERIDAYVWEIQAFVPLTPGFDLTDIKVIYADGFHAGETLLGKLGINHNCKIVLNHMHLLNADIGAWPKFFGLPAWATQLRDECTDLVRTYDEALYYKKLERIRCIVNHNSKRIHYVELNIHSKRHLFIKQEIRRMHSQASAV